MRRDSALINTYRRKTTAREGPRGGYTKTKRRTVGRNRNVRLEKREEKDASGDEIN